MTQISINEYIQIHRLIHMTIIILLCYKTELNAFVFLWLESIVGLLSMNVNVGSKRLSVYW